MTVRGQVDLDVWNPMNGQIGAIEEVPSKSDQGQELTTLRSSLRP